MGSSICSYLFDILEFTYLNLSLNRPSDQHQYRIIYNHIPRLTDLQRILLFHYPEHIILQIIIFSFSYNYTPSLNSYLSFCFIASFAFVLQHCLQRRLRAKPIPLGSLREGAGAVGDWGRMRDNKVNPSSKSRRLLPPLTRSPSLSEGGFYGGIDILANTPKVCIDLAVGKPYDF